MRARKGEEDDGLPCDEEGAAGETLHDPEGNQKIQRCRHGRDAGRKSHDERRDDNESERSDTAQHRSSDHKADELEGGVIDVKPGELVRRGINVANDIAASERKNGAGNRLRQCRQHDTDDKQRG
ncbi:hypothetical protein D9M69_536750 [compost metagenome]